MNFFARKPAPSAIVTTPEILALESQLEALREDGRSNPDQWRRSYVERQNLMDRLRHARNSAATQLSTRSMVRSFESARA